MPFPVRLINIREEPDINHVALVVVKIYLFLCNWAYDLFQVIRIRSKRSIVHKPAR
jgi:hypothetical protein